MHFTEGGLGSALPKPSDSQLEVLRCPTLSRVFCEKGGAL